ncbi:MAG TPA: hypothetical protein VFX15_03255 [Actinomycetes bacterium]|nr:hypothetical protein [Actinomycetes bacterium]
MTRYLDLVRWAIRLWLVETKERLEWRIDGLSARAYYTLDQRPRLMAFVDRLSPWDGARGYRRVWIRRLVTRPFFWRVWPRSLALRILSRFAPYVGPGKFEGVARSDQLKARWLYDHSEYMHASDGDTYEYGLWFGVFLDLDVPWSREPESWMLSEDSSGFVYAYHALNAEAAEIAFDNDQHAYNDWLDEANEDGGWREGQPEFNGAFGIID